MKFAKDENKAIAIGAGWQMSKQGNFISFCSRRTKTLSSLIAPSSF